MTAPSGTAVCLIVYQYPFDRSPSLQSLARDLASTHALTVIVDPRHASGLPEDLAGCVRVGPDAVSAPMAAAAPRRGRLEAFARERAPQRLRRWLRDVYILRELVQPLPRYLRFLRACLREADGTPVLIVADKPSLLAALLAGRIPRIYYSLEATPLREEDSFTYKALNLLESLYSRRARPWVIAQSPARAALVQPDADRRLILPVTSAGDPLPRSDYLRRRFGLQPQCRLLVAAGGLGADQMTLEIVQQVPRWPAHWVLVLHAATGQFAPELRAAVSAPGVSGRVHLSDERMDIAQAEAHIYASADVGIAYYRDIGFNYRHTAYSSGKLAAFLRAGVPVIVPDFPEFRDAVARFAFGRTASVPDMGGQLARLFEHYDEHAQAARVAFASVYRYSNYAGAVGRVVDQIASAAP